MKKVLSKINNRVKLLLVVCAFCLSGSLFAQHTVSGLISEKEDPGKLLSDVKVIIPEFNRGCLSREGGTYIIRNVGIGIVHLQFSKYGYKTVVKTINTIDSATVINIEMQPGYSFENLTAFSSDSKSPDEIPFSIDVYSASELKRAGTSSLLKSLAYKPGVDLFSMGNLQKPVIRGLSLNNLLMVQSGSRINNFSWNELEDYGVTEEGVDRIEIVRGPSALLYGSNTSGGVIIFRDENSPAVGTIEGDVNLNLFNNTAGLNLDAGIRGAGENGIIYSFRMGGKSHTSYIQGEGSEVRKNTEINNFAYNSGSNSIAVKGMVGLSERWGQSKLTLHYKSSEHELIKSMSDSAIEAMGVENEERNRESLSPFVEQVSIMAASENIYILKKSQLNLNLSFQSSERKQEEMKTSSMYFDFKYISDIAKKFGYTAGIQGSYQKDEVSSFVLYGQNNHASSTGVYALARYDLSKVNFLAGMRYDLNKQNSDYDPFDKVYNAASGSAGLAWHPGEEITVKLNASTGYVLPASGQVNEYLTVRSFSGIIQGNSGLKSENNYNGELGFLWSSRNINVSLNGYLSKLKNYMYPEVIGSDSTYQTYLYNYSYADADLNGGEFLVSFHPENLKWFACISG